MSLPIPSAEILSQGDEVITGQVADTNAAWLAARLTDLGFAVVRHTSVGDRLDDLVALFREAGARSDVVICTGGLGPTDDDLTLPAVGQAFGMPLQLDPVALDDLVAKYARLARRMPEVNRKQVILPVGATRLDNDFGTAPGVAVAPQDGPGRAWMAFLPGVPREMRGMFQQRILPALRDRFDLAPGHLVTLRTTGCGESDLQERIGVGRGLPGGADPFVLSYRTQPPQNVVKLRFAAGLPADRIAQIVQQIAGRIGSPLFAIEGLPAQVTGVPVGRDLASVVGDALVRAGQSLAVAESCTGGRLAADCTAIPGASAWFVEGVVTYANAAKQRVLGVPEALLAQHGAVSEPVARAMAQGLRERSGATWALATTGIAGPDGGSPTKPVGLVHLALAGPDTTQHRELRLSGDRERVQILASAAALDLLRRQLGPPAGPRPA